LASANTTNLYSKYVNTSYTIYKKLTKKKPLSTKANFDSKNDTKKNLSFKFLQLNESYLIKSLMTTSDFPK
jgi:hypothetical protein